MSHFCVVYTLREKEVWEKNINSFFYKIQLEVNVLTSKEVSENKVIKLEMLPEQKPTCNKKQTFQMWDYKISMWKWNKRDWMLRLGIDNSGSQSQPHLGF